MTTFLRPLTPSTAHSPGVSKELAQPRLVDLDARRLLDRQPPVADLERAIDDLGVELQKNASSQG